MEVENLSLYQERKGKCPNVKKKNMLVGEIRRRVRKLYVLATVCDVLLSGIHLPKFFFVLRVNAESFFSYGGCFFQSRRCHIS